MAVSLPDSPAARALLVVCVLLAPALLLAASPRALPRGTNTDRVIELDAESWFLDLALNHVVLEKVSITQGGTSIKAAQAEADGPELKFDDSHWEFRGDVRIRFETGKLDSDTATVSFRGNRIARADAKGSPAKFEQQIQGTQKPTRGEAGNIDYDVIAGRMTLTKGTWFTDGRNEMRTEALVYSVREKRLQSGGEAAPTQGGRIHITIQPDDAGAVVERPAP